MSAVLSCVGLRKAFGGLQAIDEISLDIPPGRITGVVGPNGAGKTTLFNLLAGFLYPDEGRVLLGGRTITYLSTSRRARLGVVRTFQEARSFEQLTALENVVAYTDSTRVGLGALLRRSWVQERSATAERARAALDRVGIAHLADTPAGTLPFGDQRLLTVARVIATDAQVVLLDEPMAGLSGIEIERVTDIVRSLAVEGRGVGLIDHNIQAVVDVCDSITVMHNGALLASGTPDEVIADEEVLRVYIGSVD